MGQSPGNSGPADTFAHDAGRLVIIGLQQTFLQMVFDQVTALFKEKLKVRTLALNELAADPPVPGETILYFSKGQKAIVQPVVPNTCPFILAKREALVFNMDELLSLPGAFRILVVNDVRANTEQMTKELDALGLDHIFLPFYPDAPLPDQIDYVVTAGERMLVPRELKNCPIIDIGLRFITLETVFQLFDHFGLGYAPAQLAQHYMRTMMVVSKKWPVLGQNQTPPDQVQPGNLMAPQDYGLAELKKTADQLTRHGFLSESYAILAIYHGGKELNKALGRSAVREELGKNGYRLSTQQLRLKLERMNDLGLLIVRPGRGGTTLSDKGQAFFDFLAGSQTGHA